MNIHSQIFTDDSTSVSKRVSTLKWKFPSDWPIVLTLEGPNNLDVFLTRNKAEEIANALLDAVQEYDTVDTESDDSRNICPTCSGTGDDPTSSQRPDDGGGFPCHSCGGSGVID